MSDAARSHEPSDDTHSGPSLTLQEAADRLGVHYMTAYRYVKLGLLYAEKHKGAWRVTEADLHEFRTGTTGVESTPGTAEETQRRFEEAVLRSDEPEGWRILEEWASNAPQSTDVHVELVATTMASIGRRWADGELTIAEEHQASQVVARLLARYGPSVAPPGRRRGRVVVGGAPGDPHRLPTALFADLVRSRGVDVTDLGANVPPESFLEAVRREAGKVVVCISVTGPGHHDGVRRAVAAIRSEYPDAVIAVGGGAITSKETAVGLGGDVWHDDPRVGAEMVAEAARSRS